LGNAPLFDLCKENNSAGWISASSVFSADNSIVALDNLDSWGKSSVGKEMGRLMPTEMASKRLQ